MVGEAIDFRYLLLNSYKKLKLSENEVVVLLLIDQLIDEGNPMITADLLSLKMTLSVSEIDKILANLLKKGHIDFVVNWNQTVTTLDPLKKTLYREFQLSMAKEHELDSNKAKHETLSNIYQEFEKYLNRPLSPLEISKIREWISLGYSDEMIINALKEAINKGKKSLRSVDKILLNNVARNDHETEGFTAISDTWDKNIEETIRIASTPWIDDDDDED